MPTREEALAELYRRGKLDDRQKAIAEELARRGRLQLDVPAAAASEQPPIGPDDSPGILDYLMHAGETAATFGSGVVAEPVAGIAGLAKSITSGLDAGAETAKQVREAIQYQPKGEMTVKAFQNLGNKISPVVEPVVKTFQGAADAAADTASNPNVAGAVGAAVMSLPAVIPEILGLRGTRAAKKMALRRIIQQTDDVTSVFDDVGVLRPEIKTALASAGIPEDEFMAVLPKDAPGQASRAQRFQEVGIEPSRGELGKDFAQRKKEQQLLVTAADTASEPFRQFKLKQSEGIKSYLEKTFGKPVSTEETGQLIQDALTGRRKLLRTERNELYQSVAENSKDVGGVPIFPETMRDAIPDDLTLQRLAIQDEAGTKKLNDWLTRFGVKEPTPEQIEKGFQTEVLNLENFDVFRQGLNNIGKSSDSVKVATIPITKALDAEVDELVNATSLAGKGVPESVLEPLKQARATVRQLKTEFSPKALVGRLIDTKPDGFTPITDASKVYDKLAARSTSVEDVRRVMNSIKSADVPIPGSSAKGSPKVVAKSEEAISSLQASVMLDLINAGFSTPSHQIGASITFNPVAFQRRLKNIGLDKVDAIFANNRDSFRKIRNIDNIASDLIPPAGAVPKGSESAILDLANRLGLAGISAKIPGGPILIGAMQKLADPVKTSIKVRQALNASPDIIKLQSLADLHYPGLAAAYGWNAAVRSGEEPNE